MYLKLFATNAWRHMNLILLTFYQQQDQKRLKQSKLCSNIVILKIEKEIGDGIHRTLHQYPTINNKCMKDYNPNKESSCLIYCHTSNIYG